MFHLLNVHDSLIIHYPLLLIKGKLDPFCGCTHFESNVNHSSSFSTHLLSDTAFKLFVLLEVGENCLILSCAHYSATLLVIYAGPAYDESLFVIQPVYVLCSDDDDDGTFQTPQGSPSTIKNAVRRIGFGIRLLQTLTAESFHSEWGQRRTFFCKELDTDHLYVPCWIHRTDLTREEVYTLSPMEIWRILGREFHSAYKNQFKCTIWVAFMACTRFVPQKTSPSVGLSHEAMCAMTKAHFALGAGGLALLGTATLHAWPESLDELHSTLTDIRRLDCLPILDDTAYRHTFWAAFATGLGSVWHELGHCFGLDHTPDGIMNRGGDDIHLCMGFPPIGSTCGHGCSNVDEQTEWVDVPMQLNPPAPFPKILQFRSCIVLNPLSSTCNHPMRAECWAHCRSVWHQGSAFWGFTCIAKLSQSRWISRAVK